MPTKKVMTYSKKLAVPKEKLEEYKEAFDMFDADHGGTISCDEIYKIMKNYGNPVSKKEVVAMIAKIDTSGDGELDFEEFVTLMEINFQEVTETEEDEVLRAFKSFDKDNDNQITNYEFRYILTKIGNNRLTEEEVDELFKECDLQNDGVVNYVDFINFWKQTKES